MQERQSWCCSTVTEDFPPLQKILKYCKHEWLQARVGETQQAGKGHRRREGDDGRQVRVPGEYLHGVSMEYRTFRSILTKLPIFLVDNKHRPMERVSDTDLILIISCNSMEFGIRRLLWSFLCFWKDWILIFHSKLLWISKMVQNKVILRDSPDWTVFSTSTTTKRSTSLYYSTEPEKSPCMWFGEFLFLLLLTSSASTCLLHSRNLGTAL